jgi:hypothetical protein
MARGRARAIPARVTPADARNPSSGKTCLGADGRRPELG